MVVFTLYDFDIEENHEGRGMFLDFINKKIGNIVVILRYYCFLSYCPRVPF